MLHVHEFAHGRFGRLQVDCAEGEREQAVDEIVSDLRAAGVTAGPLVCTTDFGRIARAILVVAEEECVLRLVTGGAVNPFDGDHVVIDDVLDPVWPGTQPVVPAAVESLRGNGSSARAATAAPMARMPS